MLGKLTDFKSSDHHASFDASVHFGGTVQHDETTKTTVLFRNLGDKLASLIDTHATRYGGDAFILAAVAWFSSGKLLDALIRAKEKGVTVMVVVQKEDFLRQDSKDVSKEKFKEYLREKYNGLGKINTGGGAYTAISVLMEAKAAIGEDPTGEFWWDSDGNDVCEAVRCVGNHNSNSNPSFPRMHNKFMVFGVSDFTENNGLSVMAQSVWSGSFNCSACADKSFENALIIENEKIATMYMKEFALLFILSERLDWTSEWMRPEVSYST